MFALKDVLTNRTCRMLNATAKAHRIKLNTKLHKPQQIEQLHQLMVAKDCIRKTCRQLTAEELKALQSLQAADNQLPVWTFTQGYGEIRRYRPWRSDCSRQPWKRPISVAEKLYYWGLIDIMDDDVWLPLEVLNCLPPLPLPKPMPSMLKPALTPDLLIVDLAIFLGVLLYQPIQLSWGRWLRPSAIRTLIQRFYGKEDVRRSELQMERLRFVHYLATVSGLVRVQEDYRLIPTVKAWQWLGQTPQQQWKVLLEAWQRDSGRIKSQWAAFRFPIINQGVFAALLDRLRPLQPERVYSMESLQAAIRPYIMRESDEEIAWLLKGPLAWAGIVAVQSDGMSLSTAGKAVLDGNYRGPDGQQPAILVSEPHRLRVHLTPTLGLHPLVQFLSWASSDEQDYWVDGAAVRRAVQQGYDAMGVVEVLATLCERPLPVELLERVKAWQRDASALTLQHLTVLTATDSQVLADIRADRHLRPMIAETLSAHHLAVEPHLAGKLAQGLKRRGKSVTGQPSCQMGERKICKTTTCMSDYLYLAVQVYRALQGLNFMPIRMPSAVSDSVVQDLDGAQISQLDQIAADVVDGIKTAIDGFGPMGLPVTNDNRDCIRAAVQKAYQHQAALCIEYFSPGHGRPSQRTIEPLLPISQQNGAEYIEAWCQLEGASRTFRLDRIISVSAH